MAGRVKLSVTAEDIEKGIVGRSTKCAVARCIARTRPGAHHIKVDVSAVRWTESGERFVYVSPLPVQHYIVRFDGGADIPPFTTVLTERVLVQRKERTPAGKKVQAARSAARRASKKAQTAPPARRAKATATAKKAPRKVAAVKKANGGPQARMVGAGRTKAPPVSPYKSDRTYGHRSMLINQDGGGIAALTGEA